MVFYDRVRFSCSAVVLARSLLRHHSPGSPSFWIFWIVVVVASTVVA